LSRIDRGGTIRSSAVFKTGLKPHKWIARRGTLSGYAQAANEMTCGVEPVHVPFSHCGVVRNMPRILAAAWKCPE
jgi:hypothetical protein